MSGSMYNSIGNYYEGVRLASSVVRRREDIQIIAIFETIADLRARNINTRAIRELQKEIIKLWRK